MEPNYSSPPVRTPRTSARAICTCLTSGTARGDGSPATSSKRCGRQRPCRLDRRSRAADGASMRRGSPVGRGDPKPYDLWKLVEPLLPPERPKPKGGRPPTPGREALTDIIFVLNTGIQWQDLPRD